MFKHRFMLKSWSVIIDGDSRHFMIGLLKILRKLTANALKILKD